MPKTKTAVAAPDPRLPATALADIAAYPDMAPWWSAWADVGDAQNAVDAARAEWAKADREAALCRIAAKVQGTQDWCACGKCRDRVETTQAALVAAKASTRDAVAALKAVAVETVDDSAEVKTEDDTAVVR